MQLSFLNELKTRYPLMEKEDVCKAIFQSMLGVGHLLGRFEQVTNRLRSEMEQVRFAGAPRDEALTDSLGTSYCRLNLRPACALGICPEWISRMMLASRQGLHTREDVHSILNNAFGQDPMHDRVLDPSWLPNHSNAYKNAYLPAYRVIDKRFATLLPVLTAIAAFKGQRLLITIDGPCGSGKSTLADQLASIIRAPIVHTDDYVIPHPRKTPERLSMPGGNEDHERLAEELLRPWQNTGSAQIKPYLFMEDRFGDTVDVEGDTLILEGSYSNMPDLSAYAGIRIWIDLSRDEQLRRLQVRESKASMERFLSRWIPLEDAYHKAYHLPDAGCIRIDGTSIIP